MSTLSKQPFISFYERKYLLYLYHAQIITHFAVCTLVGSQHVFYHGYESVKEILSKKVLRKTGKSAQNDKEPQPLKKHQKSNIMNKEERNLAWDKKKSKGIDSSVTKTIIAK